MYSKSKQLTRIVITGTPCTGKTTLAKKLAAMLNVSYVSINDFAVTRGFFWREEGVKEKIVDIARLSKALNAYLNDIDGYAVEGHLACEFAVPADAVVVLRCSPSVLAKRYAKRKYPKAKSDENLLAEILDYCLQESELRYRKEKIVQLDNSRNMPAKSAYSKIVSKKSDAVDWSPLLLRGEFAYLSRQ